MKKAINLTRVPRLVKRLGQSDASLYFMIFVVRVLIESDTESMLKSAEVYKSEGSVNELKELFVYLINDF